MQDNSTKYSIIKDRILLFADYKRINANKIYNKTGLTRGILSQENGISESNLLKFLNFYPDINPTWLLTGKGNMINSESNVVTEPAENLYRKDELINQLLKRIEELEKSDKKLKGNVTKFEKRITDLEDFGEELKEFIQKGQKENQENS